MRWKSYFKLKEFGLYYNRPQEFVTLQHGSQILYVVWTSLWLAYHLIWILLEAYWSLERGNGKWMLLLTNLSYITLAVFAFVDFVCCLYVLCLRPDVIRGDVQELPWYLKFQWILMNICGQAAVQVTLLYWTLIATSTKATTINKHGINLVYILLVVIFSSKPIKFQHVYMPVMSSLFYVILNLIYYAASGRILYPFLNWAKPGKTALLSILFITVSTPIAYFLLLGIYRLKLFVYNKFFASRFSENRRDSFEKDGDALEKFKLENDGLDSNRNSTEKYNVEKV